MKSNVKMSRQCASFDHMLNYHQRPEVLVTVQEWLRDNYTAKKIKIQLRIIGPIN